MHAMKTYSTRPVDIQRRWHVLDASTMPLGRLASEAARLIRGKHKPIFAPHLDTGDYVVIVNASRVVLTGRKREQKLYTRHSGYPGGLKTRTVRELQAVNPCRVVEHAVYGMLPKTALGNRLRRHLKVYAGPEHPHRAQVEGPPQPVVIVKPKRAAAKRAADETERRAMGAAMLGAAPAAEEKAQTAPRAAAAPEMAATAPASADMPESMPDEEDAAQQDEQAEE